VPETPEARKRRCKTLARGVSSAPKIYPSPIAEFADIDAKIVASNGIQIQRDPIRERGEITSHTRTKVRIRRSRIYTVALQFPRLLSDFFFAWVRKNYGCDCNYWILYLYVRVHTAPTNRPNVNERTPTEEERKVYRQREMIMRNARLFCHPVISDANRVHLILLCRRCVA